MRKRPTLMDVARAARVSRATASLVVRGSKLVKAETRARVETAIEELDYIPDAGAARLRGQESRTVGVVVPNLVNPFFAEFVEGVDRTLDRENRVVMLAKSDDDPDRQSRILRRLRSHNTDGLILCPAEGTPGGALEGLRHGGLPVVQALRHLGAESGDFAGPDFGTAVRQSVEHLAALGHRRIAYLSVEAVTSARTERVAAWERAVEALGLDRSGLVEVPFSWDGAPHSAEHLLRLDPRPTAVICFNDILAAGLVRGLADRGLVAGRDVSVVGHDDLALMSLCARPQLTTVASFPRAVGEEAARLLLRRLAEPEAPTRRIIVPPRLVVRETTGPCPALDSV